MQNAFLLGCQPFAVDRVLGDPALGWPLYAFPLDCLSVLVPVLCLCIADHLQLWFVCHRDLCAALGYRAFTYSAL
jgi:hypothetical protein